MPVPNALKPKERKKPAPRIDLERDRLISRRELSRLSGYDVKTLRTLDCERRGCRYLKLGTSQQARVVYRLSDAQAWLASLAVESAPTADAQE